MSVLDDLEQVAVVQRWSRRQVVEALTALHGVDVVTAMTVLADLGDPMTLNASSVPALGVEERSDEAPRAGRASPTPDPEVVAKPKRRQFTPHTHSTMTSINSCVLFLSTRGSSSFESDHSPDISAAWSDPALGSLTGSIHIRKPFGHRH